MGFFSCFQNSGTSIMKIDGTAALCENDWVRVNVIMRATYAMYFDEVFRVFPRTRCEQNKLPFEGFNSFAS